jgi:hypothetical protein
MSFGATWSRLPCAPNGDKLPGSELCSTTSAKFAVKLMKNDVVFAYLFLMMAD